MEQRAPRFAQQLKKGVLEMLVLQLIARQPRYGYELLLQIREGSGGLLALKEGTLYPILYRLEDDEMIAAQWSQPEGKSAPKKIYTATEKGQSERHRRYRVWKDFYHTVNGFYQEDNI